MSASEVIPSFSAVSIRDVSPIYGIVNGIDQTEAHDDSTFKIFGSKNVLITSTKNVRVVNPNNPDDFFDLSAVQIIGSLHHWYYQAASFQRSFGGDGDHTLQNLVLVVE